jgi:SNF2 family DNA or RNA helicase
MLSLSPGLGKTLTSAYAAGLRGFENILVVCPASLLFYWKGELEKWTDKLPLKPCPEIWHRKIGPGGDEGLDEVNTAYWAVTNPETVAKNLEKILEFEFDCLIVDESIMYKHRDSQRSQAIKDLAQGIETTWFLTGAPATRYLDDLWHQFHILKPKGYSSYWRFARKYCIIEDNDWGSKVVANRPEAENEIKKNFADVYFARSQDDVADIPDWIMEDVDIPMLPAQDKAYDTLRKELYVQVDSLNPNERITVSNHLSLMIRSVQVASNPLLVGGVNSAGKWDALPELMEIYPGPFIVWCNFIKTGELIRDNLAQQKVKWAFTADGKLRVALANGATKMEDRNSVVNAFQNGELDVLILNNQVGKFGFSITKARTAFFLERMFDDSYFQCLHRNRRIGTTQSPVIVNMRSVTQSGKRTIDHLIHSTLDYRVGMIKDVTAGDLREVFAE